MNQLLIIDPFVWRISQFTQIPMFSLVERKIRFLAPWTYLT